MKIVYLIAGTYRNAGMERVLANKVNWLAKKGHEITIITTDQLGRRPAFKMASSISCQDLGINYEKDNGKSFIIKASRFPWRILLHRLRLARALKKIKPDVTVSMFCNDASFLPRIKDGSHKVLEVHFCRFKRLQYGRKGIWGLADRLLSRRDEKTARRFERFVVLTHEDAEYWDVPGLRVIPNAPTFRNRIPSSLDSKTVLAVGRYCSQKHFSHLLHAWDRIDPAIRKGWTLRIVGSGEEKVYLESIIVRLHLESSVKLGPESHMDKLYRKAAVMALTSRYEGMPMVLLEAQAAGLPIVSYDCKCGPRDVVTDSVDGFLVPEGHIDLLAGRLALLMGDAELRKRMGQAAYKAADRFSTERVMGMWSDLFDGLCKRRKTIVVSAVNLRKGGTLAVLQSCLEHLSHLTEEYRVVALVHSKDLCQYPGIEYIEMPWCTRSWAHRLWAEYVSMHRISRRICGQDSRPWLWLSLHDTTPRVRAERQAVYCHTSFPFMKVRAHDFLMDYKIPLFAMLTRFSYRINVMRNDYLIVQQDWFRAALAGVTGFPAERIAVAPPSFAQQQIRDAADAGLPVFLYPSTPDCHKNFETFCEAAALVERRIGPGRFRAVLTVDGSENRYARWLKARWGGVASIEFAGLMTREKLYECYAEASCLVFASRVESWGLPISEFLPSEKPMILPDLPYAHETASSAPKVAFFDPDDAMSLAVLIESLIGGDMASFAKVPDHGHAQPCVSGWQALFDLLLK